MQERKISQNPFISPLEWGTTCLNGRKQSTLEWQDLKCNIYTNIQNNVTSWPASNQLAILFLQDGSTYFMELFNIDNTWQYTNFELMTKPQDYHADRNCHSPSSRCLLQSAAWRHTHTPFRHSAGTWQAALLSQCTQSGILYIIHTYYETQSYFPINAGSDWGEGHSSFNGISFDILN